MCSRPRGFGFVEFRDPRDAEDALYHVDRNIFGGREISVVMSKESRKTPKEMMISMCIFHKHYIIVLLHISYINAGFRLLSGQQGLCFDEYLRFMKIYRHQPPKFHSK